MFIVYKRSYLKALFQHSKRKLSPSGLVVYHLLCSFGGSKDVLINHTLNAYFFPFLVADEEPQQETWTPEGGRGDKESTILQED